MMAPLSRRALSDLGPTEFEAARSLLHGSRCVFVGSGFAEAPSVAFQVRGGLGWYGMVMI